MPDILAKAANTFIVEVSKPLSEPAKEFLGEQVTVRVDRSSRISPSDIHAGQTFTFLTVPLVYADTLAVAGDVDRPGLAVSRFVDQRPDLILQERLRMSDLVVSGTIADSRVQPFPLEDESEHGPSWQQVDILVRTVEKGAGGKVVPVVFPAANSFIWSSSPKFRPGQQGIWLLRRTPDLRRQQPPLTALHPLDFQNPDQLGRIRRLLQKPSSVPPQTYDRPAGVANGTGEPTGGRKK